ncbi:serine/threonine protein kinase [Streptomyces cinnamoneus]|uniref:Serine/threonine protein kinase n=1 Tax=Streptomyces cinnamoneus TaxID=53446 RepID=A0A2G1XHZ2_STRCJ|nr:serine/threonine-protein kinase [Streptomyces cinnamoneus]PHQ50811.1 serine/threonine protein kinase [Streptomyces cinnamoneus]PPT13931.1 serine/threonine protein kinase [Streptomyces cinnamoneus]
MEGLSPEDPRTLGAYRLLGRLGAGGMGRVYLARSDRGRTVAVKLVQPELACQEEFRRRFRQEVQAARRVGGEWTAPVLDADTEADVPWVATGYIAGPSLRQVVDHDFGPLPERSVRILGAGLARALTAVHAAGIVHRDLKPSNVLITLDGPRVIDFGIARALETVTDGGLTRTGAAVGSPGFMSPEQVRGAQVTPASDVFCLGSVLAYAATGRMPFGTADSGVHALMYRIAQEEPDLDGVPAPLRPLISEFLAKDPAERPTPEQVLEQTGVEDLLGDLRTAEPWLPGGLVAQLGRHAVRLLNVEEPAGAPAPPISAAEPPTRVEPPVAARPADPPTVTTPAQPLPPQVPGPHAPYGYGSPYHHPTVVVAPAPPPRRSKTPVIVTAIVVAGLLTGGGTVYLLNRETHDTGHGAGPVPASSASARSTAPSGGTASSAGPATPAPGPPTAVGASPTPTSGGQGFEGTWQSSFGSGSRVNTRTITVSQGPAAGVTIDGSGVLDDGSSYVCTWRTTVTGGGTAGTPMRLGPSSVTRAMPTSACQPGSASELVLLPDGRMRRDFADSGTKDASLVYRKLY